MLISMGGVSQTMDLDPVQITSSLQEKRIRETGRNIVILDKETLQKIPGNSLDEILRFVPGIEVTITDTIDRGAKSRPRSQDEATAYFVEIGSTAEEGATFWDHFESNGWKVGGKTAMKNWHSAAKNWVRRSGKNQHAGSNKRTVGDRQATINYEISFKQLEAERDAITNYIIGRTREKQNRLDHAAARRLTEGEKDISGC